LLGNPAYKELFEYYGPDIEDRIELIVDEHEDDKDEFE